MNEKWKLGWSSVARGFCGNQSKMVFASFWGSVPVPNENLNNWLLMITKALKATIGKYWGTNSEQLTCILTSSFVLYPIRPQVFASDDTIIEAISHIVCGGGSNECKSPCMVMRGWVGLQKARGMTVTFSEKTLSASTISTASTISSMGQQHVLLGMAQRGGLCSLPVKGLGFTWPFCAGDGVSLCSTASQNMLLKMVLSTVCVVENNQVKWRWTLFAMAQSLHSS